MSNLRLVMTGLGLIAVTLALVNEDEIRNHLNKVIERIKKYFGREKAETKTNQGQPPKEDDAKEILGAFCCPISLEIMENPVITPYGHCFEKKCIEEWLKKHDYCPLTMKTLRSRDLKICYTMKAAIEQFKLYSRFADNWNN